MAAGLVCGLKVWTPYFIRCHNSKKATKQTISIIIDPCVGVCCIVSTVSVIIIIIITIIIESTQRVQTSAEDCHVVLDYLLDSHSSKSRKSFKNSCVRSVSWNHGSVS